MNRACTIGAAVLIGSLGFSGCSSAADSVEVEKPATVEEVGPDLWEITLTDRAAQRTGVELGEVASEQVNGEDRLVVPYSAVIYHYEGSTWTYTNPKPLVYLRQSIDIDYIEGDVAVLNDGPAAGTSVVLVGAAELYGVEFGIGK